MARIGPGTNARVDDELQPLTERQLRAWLGRLGFGIRGNPKTWKMA